VFHCGQYVSYFGVTKVIYRLFATPFLPLSAQDVTRVYIIGRPARLDGM